MQTEKLTKTFAENKVRAHVPTTDANAPEAFKPVYEATKARIENVFGKKSPKHWTASPGTCSKCWSIAPAVVTEH